MSEREDKRADCEFASSLAVANSNKESSTRDFSSKQDDSPIDIHSSHQDELEAGLAEYVVKLNWSPEDSWGNNVQATAGPHQSSGEHSTIAATKTWDASIAPFAALAARQRAAIEKRQDESNNEERPSESRQSASSPEESQNKPCIRRSNRSRSKQHQEKSRNDATSEESIFAGEKSGIDDLVSSDLIESPDWATFGKRSRIIQTQYGPAMLLESPPPGFETGGPEAVSSNASVDEIQRRKFQRWSDSEDEILRQAMEAQGNQKPNWRYVSKNFFSGTRTPAQCKGRWSKALRPGLKVGEWTEEEDKTILQLHSDGLRWSAIAEHMPGRIGEHIRERYINVLDPGLKKTPWTATEDKILFKQQKIIGNKWTAIAAMLPGRSENAVKNRWHNAKMTQRRRMRKHTLDKLKAGSAGLKRSRKAASGKKAKTKDYASDSDVSWSE